MPATRAASWMREAGARQAGGQAGGQAVDTCDTMSRREATTSASDGGQSGCAAPLVALSLLSDATFVRAAATSPLADRLIECSRALPNVM